MSFLREGIAEVPVPYYFSSAFYHEVQFFLEDFNVKSTQKLKQCCIDFKDKQTQKRQTYGFCKVDKT